MELTRLLLSGTLQKVKEVKNVGAAINFMIARINISPTQVGVRAGIPVPKVHRIINNKIESPKLEDLIRIILAFQLTLDDAEYFLALGHRALRPRGLDPLDDAFRDIIEIYSNCKIEESNESWITRANTELNNRNLKWPSDKDLSDGGTAKKDMA